MKTELSYYLILFVYISLWTCQLIVSHLTHSLIILTDSYINIYRILDISVGIIHLRTQHQLQSRQLGSNVKSTLAGKLFDCICTYKYKRLPLLGAFVNGLFLAALLMSAAIEGIQTCFHSGHSAGGHDKTSILMQNELTYPGVLIGFALVALIMQYCSARAHEMREEELGSESLLNISTNEQQVVAVQQNNNHIEIKELSASHLEAGQHEAEVPELINNKKKSKYDLNHRKQQQQQQQLQNPNLEDSQKNKWSSSQISLRSLKFTTNLDSLPSNSSNTPGCDLVLVNSISSSTTTKDLEASPPATQPIRIENSKSNKTSNKDDNWLYVRYLVSPVVLIIDALIVYWFKSEELIVEVADAGLAVIIVVLLFAASWPPMKRAGRVLLQTVPDGVDLDKLTEALRQVTSSADSVLEVRELKVWSLTPTSNRVASCQLVIDKNVVRTEQQIKDILRGAKFKFLEQNIKCTTIEPIFSSKPSKVTS